MGRLEEAAENFRSALQLAPDLAEAHVGLGDALKALGRPDEAAENLRRALKLKPRLAEAHLSLGNALRAQDRLDEAAECFRNAIGLNPDYAEAYSNLGNVLREQGDLDAAIASFRKALEFRPEMAGAHNNLGMALQIQGKLDEAAVSFEQALMHKPDYAEAGINVGHVFREQGKLDAAIGCYRKVLELSPGIAEAHSGLAGALREQGEQDAAAESYQRALALDADCISAHLGLGKLCQDTGRFDDARRHFDRVLELKPQHPAAWAALAGLRKMTPDDRPWAETAQRLLGAAKKPEERMRLCHALGKYHDDTCQYEAAFGYYEHANRLKRERIGAFDREAFRQAIDSIIAAHPPEVARQRHAGSSSSRRPLFIAGMPRSGSSLTEQILASHPSVFGAGELRFWGEQAQKHEQAFASGYRDADLLRDMASRCEAELERHSETALRVVDKMPGNFMHLGLIHAAFPDARILHTQRNPADTCLSIYFQDFNNRHKYAADLDDLAFYYREYHRLMAHWREVLPPEVFMEVPYESLLEDQEGWSRRIVGFVGLEWDERCLDFHETGRKVGTASNWQVRQKIYKTSKERWRNYEQFAGPLLPLLELAE
jgi:tetratricopeptide (TPR) repeat protein